MNACSAACGWCNRCTDDDPAPGWVCTHPLHWMDPDGNCRLCGAQEPTITKEQQQRQLAVERAEPVSEYDNVRRG